LDDKLMHVAEHCGITFLRGFERSNLRAKLALFIGQRGLGQTSEPFFLVFEEGLTIACQISASVRIAPDEPAPSVAMGSKDPPGCLINHSEQ
jgi:hypothetical protein